MFSETFTKEDAVSGLTGGAMIGLAAATLLLFNGNIMGMSGIFSTTTAPRKALTDPALYWKLVFLASFLLTANFFYASKLKSDTAAPPLAPTGFVLSGLLVGFGTRLGNGCTSGHGICGLARLSKRSIVAVTTFMIVAIITVALTSGPRLEFLRSPEVDAGATSRYGDYLAWSMLFFALVARWLHGTKGTKNDYAKIGPAVVSGFLFALGLAKGGMIYRSKVLSFLNIRGIQDGTWDPSLACVMGGGVVVSFVSYQFVKGHHVASPHKATLECPLALQPGSSFNVPTNTQIDADLVIGAALFGVGWGIGGICPGPGLFLGAVGVPAVLFMWLPACWVGSYLANEYKTNR